uniref:Uncharacterized protein n=1 Tax=Acrobeloides nanus TaxID=290746 RepID=A0A914DMI2_9BILA
MNGTSGICRMQKYCAAPQCQTSVYFSTTAGQLLALTKQVDIVEWQQVIEAYCKSKPSETTQLHCSMKGYLTPDATMTACGALAETITTMAFAITTGPVSSCSRCLSTGTASCTTVNSNTAYCICYTGWQV